MASQDMGTLLLKGWAMLEECCEKCQVPLMRSPDKTQELCVECKTDYKKKAQPKQQNQQQKKEEVAQVNNKAQETQKFATMKEVSEEDSLDEDDPVADAILAKKLREQEFAQKRMDEEKKKILAARLAQRQKPVEDEPVASVKISMPELSQGPTVVRLPQQQQAPTRVMSSTGGEQRLGSQTVVASVLKKQIELGQRLENETDLTQIDRLLDAIMKCQTTIDKLL